MNYTDLKAQEAAARASADQLRSGRTRTWTHATGLAVTMTAADGGIVVAVDCPELRTGNLGSDPLQWLTAEQLRFVARCREKLETWMAGGAEPAGTGEP